MPPRLYLIRHGETEWSLTGRYTSRTDLPLTPLGEQQAVELGQRLSDLNFGHVWTSPRLRARQTCDRCLPQAKAEVHPDLQEWDYGDYEGHPSAAVHAQHPNWSLFRKGCPGGETPTQVSDRADRLITQLHSTEGTVALFTHGHFGRVLGVRWIGLPVAAAEHFLLGTASFSILSHDPRQSTLPVVELWNSDRTFQGGR